MIARGWWFLSLLLALFFLFAAFRPDAFADYQPLIQTGFLDGVKADVQTAAGSYLLIIVGVLGVGLIIRVLQK